MKYKANPLLFINSPNALIVQYKEMKTNSFVREMCTTKTFLQLTVAEKINYLLSRRSYMAQCLIQYKQLDGELCYGFVKKRIDGRWLVRNRQTKTYECIEDEQIVDVILLGER